MFVRLFILVCTVIDLSLLFIVYLLFKSTTVDCPKDHQKNLLIKSSLLDLLQESRNNIDNFKSASEVRKPVRIFMEF